MYQYQDNKIHVDALREPWERFSGTVLLLAGLLPAIAVFLGTVVTLGIPWVIQRFLDTFILYYIRTWGIQVSDNQYVDIHRFVGSFSGRLGIETPEVYVLEETIFNAFAAHIAGTKVVVLYSSTIDRIALTNHPEDIAFIIGHELGHHAAGHLGTMATIKKFGAWVPLLYSSYSRAREITCDRVGLACVGQPEIALRGIGYLTVGGRLAASTNYTQAIYQHLRYGSSFFVWFPQLFSFYPTNLERLHAIYQHASSNGWSPRQNQDVAVASHSGVRPTSAAAGSQRPSPSESTEAWTWPTLTAEGIRESRPLTAPAEQPSLLASGIEAWPGEGSPRRRSTGYNSTLVAAGAAVTVAVVAVGLFTIFGEKDGRDQREPTSRRFVATQLANVRGAPSQRGAVVGQVRADTACDVSEEVDGWSRVRCVPVNDSPVDGWIKSTLLSDAPAAPSTQLSGTESGGALEAALGGLEGGNVAAGYGTGGMALRGGGGVDTPDRGSGDSDSASGERTEEEIVQNKMAALFGDKAVAQMLGAESGGALEAALGGGKIAAGYGTGGMALRGGGGVDTPDRGSGDSGYGSGEGGLGAKTDRDVTMTQGTPVILGSLDPEIIRRIVREHAGQIRFCYESELIRTPGLLGKIVMKWVINGEGRVMQAQVAETQMKNANVENCLATKIKTWTFPMPEGGGMVVVNYPLMFEQGG